MELSQQIIDRYVSYLRLERRLKEKSIKEYLNALNTFRTEVPEPLGVKHRSEVVNAVNLIREKRRWEDQTTWRCAFLVKKFFDWATLEQIIPFNPYPFSAFRKPRPKEVVFLTEEEFSRVVENDIHLTHQDKVILWLLWDTALRREELRLLDQTDIDFDRRLIFLPAEKSKGRYGQRYVSMSERSAEYLTRQFEILRKNGIGPHILCGHNFKRINGDEITKHMVRAGKVCVPGQFVKITPRALRHSLATRMKERGASDLEIMMVLGHSDLEMTRRYSHVTRTFAASIREKYLAPAS